MPMIRIAVDAMGGDNAPQVMVQGAVDAVKTLKDIHITLLGPQAVIAPLLPSVFEGSERLTLVDAPDVIGMEESPVMAVRQKPRSTIVMGLLMVRQGEAEAFVSAGSTGAVLAGGMFRLGRIEGIERPALAPVMPGQNKPTVLIDCGANADCKPAYLSQFALMGSLFAEKVLGVAKPEVGLLNIGAEPGKGSELYKNAFDLLSAPQPYRFVGNIEAREVPKGVVDVIVADGFTGNVALKLFEGVASTLMGMIKSELTATFAGKLSGLIGKSAFRQLKHKLDASEVGGAPLLGVQGVVIKAHGNSNARAVFCAIRLARTMAECGLVDLIRQGVGELSGQQH